MSYLNIVVKTASFYLKRFQRYGVLKMYNFFGPPCTYYGEQQYVSINWHSRKADYWTKKTKLNIVTLADEGQITLKTKLNNSNNNNSCQGAVSCQGALWTRQTRWQTSRQANLNPMARWPFVSLGRYSRQSISCFLRWQSSHRRRYSGRYDSHQKTEKYSTLSSAYRFEPIAVENLGVFSSTTLNFISELGRRIFVHTGDARETSYLFQRISIMLQRFNSVLLHDTLPVDLPDLWPSDILILAFVVFNPGDLYYLGYKKIIIINRQFPGAEYCDERVWLSVCPRA